MSALGTIVLAAVLTAAPPPTPERRLVVALSRHAGIAAPRALAIATEVQAKLVGVPTAPPVVDFTACKTKRVCLLTSARNAGASVVVTVEVSSVLDDGALRVEALSVDDDGARIGLVKANGAVSELVKAATPELTEAFSSALRTTLGLVPPPPPPTVVEPAPTPTPLVEAPPPPPMVPVTAPAPSREVPASVTQAAEAPFFSTSRLAGVGVGGAGAAALVAAGVFGLEAMSAAARAHQVCPPGPPCAETTALGDYTRAVHAQNTGVTLAVGGGVALVTGALLLWLNPGAPEPTVHALVVPVPGGVSAQVGASF